MSSTLRVVVTVGGRVVDDTREALTLYEADYPPVHYIPRDDVDMSLLERTGHATYCPYKGDCAYYSIPVGDPRSTNAVWTRLRTTRSQRSRTASPSIQIASMPWSKHDILGLCEAVVFETPLRRYENAGPRT
jgi:hypothetical protein